MDNKRKDVLEEMVNNTNNDSINDDLKKYTNVKRYVEPEYKKTVEDSNATFFEKFEKTKKDFVKEKKIGKSKAQKSLKLRNKLLGFENKLRDDDFAKNTWIAFICLSVLFVIFSCICLGFMATKFNSTTDGKWQPAVGYYGDMLKTVVIFSSIILIIVPMPFIYLLGTWFVGVNGATKSKEFFFVSLTIIIISSILFLLILPMSSVIFGYVNNFSSLMNGTTPDTGGGDSGGTGGETPSTFMLQYSKSLILNFIK